jgi:SAM-dependent methyltransferase
MDDELRSRMREAYGPRALEREQTPIEPWKAQQRQRFLALLRDEGRRTLLELGAGPGKDGEFFRDQGLDVLCTDLSPEMVARCQDKGLAARVMDLAQLELARDSFDAAYALNCLLHVPDRELPAALRAIRDVLKPGGLFYAGVHGGRAEEGVWAEDRYEPKRFFALRTDARMLELVAESFQVESFERVTTGMSNGLHFQSLILRRPS